MPEPLSEAQAQTLADLALDHLVNAELPIVKPREGETAYTARVLAPLMRTWLRDVVRFEGLYLAGDGLSPLPSVNFGGLPFRPDLGVSFYGQRVLAIEVKVLDGSHIQYPVATAIGQACVYQMTGYMSAIVALVDTHARLKDVDTAGFEALTSSRVRIGHCTRFA